MIQADLDNILKNEPHLTGFGMMNRNQVLSGNNGPMRLEIINDLIQLINLILKKRKTINNEICGSYGLKHKFENILKRSHNNPSYYVSNGECIAAFIHLDYDYEIKQYNDGKVFPNVCFNITTKSVARLE